MAAYNTAVVAELNRRREKAGGKSTNPTLRNYDTFAKSGVGKSLMPRPAKNTLSPAGMAEEEYGDFSRANPGLSYTPEDAARAKGQTPTVLTDTNIRERVIPRLQQDAATTIANYDQNKANIEQQRTMADDKKFEQDTKKKQADPLAGAFDDSKETPTDPIVSQQLALIDRMMKSSDKTTRLMAERQKEIYDRQRAQQNDVAAAEQGNAGTALTRLGGRYTPGAGGQIQAQLQRANLQKLADIDDEELNAVEQLRAAQENKDFQLVGEKLKVLKDVRDARIKAQDEMKKAEAETKKENTKNINAVLTDAAKNGAPSDVIAAIAAAEDVAGAATAAAEYLQTGEYADYARAVKSAGLTPVDPNTYYSKKIYGEKGPPGSDVFGGNVPFEATIDGAAALAGSVTGEASAAKQLKALAASGDYTSLLTRLESLGRKGMGAVEGGKVFEAQNQVKAIDDLQAALDEYEANGGELGPIPATEKAMAAKLGQLSGDPKFAALATRMTIAFQKYRQAMSGAAFGVQENAQYKSVVPTGDKSFDLNRAVIQGLRDQNSNLIDNAYETQLGEGYKNVKDYVEQGLTPDGKKLLKTEEAAQNYADDLAENDPVFADSLDKALQEYPNKPYSDILEILGKPVQIGDKVSMAGGNRPQRNNNPGNVKEGGLADQYAKKNPDGTPMTDEQGHLVFASPEDGAKAVRADINAKLSGKSPAAQRKLGRQIVTLADLNKVYAEDPNWKNNVAAYAGVTPDAKVNEIPREKLITAIMKAEGYFA